MPVCTSGTHAHNEYSVCVNTTHEHDVITLSAAERRESAILSRLGALPVYMYVNSSAMTGSSTSLIST